MEHVFYISELDSLKYFNKMFSRLYFGAEFCEYLLPSRNDLQKAKNFCERNKIKFSFITPPCTDVGIKAVENLFSALPKNSEIIFNDYGVFNLIKNNSNFIPVLGRLLVSVKRDPRINFNQKFKKYFQLSNLNNKDFQRFLLKQKIFRLELDNVLQGYSFKPLKDISTSLYYPYVYITVSRKCLMGNCSKVMRFSDSETTQNKSFCRENLAIAELKDSKYPIIIKGNSQFYQNNSKPFNLSRYKINRLVFMPKIP